jgi:hypothetical protein
MGFVERPYVHGWMKLMSVGSVRAHDDNDGNGSFWRAAVIKKELA